MLLIDDSMILDINNPDSAYFKKCLFIGEHKSGIPYLYTSDSWKRRHLSKTILKML